MRCLLALAALLLAPLSAQAGDCTAIDEVRQKAADRGGSFMQVRDPQAVNAYATLYNSMPPVSSDTYTIAYLIVLGDTTVVTLGNGNELCVQWPVPNAMLQELMDRVLGVAI